MGLTRQKIVRKMKDYFTSNIAEVPAMVGEKYYDDYTGEYVSDDAYNNCVYYTSDGRHCAVGCLIPEKLYSPHIDSDSGVSANHLPDEIISYLGVDNIDFLSKCQTIHDDTAREWALFQEGHFGELFLKRIREKFPKFA